MLTKKEKPLEGGILQYIPNKPIDFNKEIKIEDFKKFEFPMNRLIIVGESLYKAYKDMGIADNLEEVKLSKNQ